MVKQQQYRLRINSDIANLGRVAEFVTEAARESGLDDRDTYNVQMAVDEAVTNVIQHAYRGSDNGSIHISCERRGNEFVVEILDFGKPFDPSKVRTPRTSGPLSRRGVGGLGIFFMKKLMDHVEFSSDAGRGNRLRMVKRVK